MTATMFNIVDYGAAELKRIYQQHVKKALTYAIVGHLVAVGIYSGVVGYIDRE